MEENTQRHTFAVCAYKDSEYIEELLDSLAAQTERSEVYIATSTPTERIQRIAAARSLPLHVNAVSAGIASDWNYALSLADTEYVTLAHQDDVYTKNFTKETLAALDRTANPILACTDYYEIRAGEKVSTNRNLEIKRKMLRQLARFPSARLVRRRILSVGCAISCPTVTLRRKRFPDFRFNTDFTNSMDWEAWLRLAREKGTFVYVPKLLMGHRIHEDSETTRTISAGIRAREDLRILESCWPGPVARRIARAYAKAEDSNIVEEESKK
ncbi:MAG: glycosyltransferase [Clostridiales Family XIII bacterium]|jgi:glycosyltransferase involved in cell wall biosynthesis|nr:glycosyltransferase [Clostridiales Family XIII bacterium]